MLGGHAQQVGQPRHRPVVLHDLADDARRAAGPPAARGPRRPRCGRAARARRRGAPAAGTRARGGGTPPAARRRRPPGRSCGHGRRRRCPVEPSTSRSMETVKAVSSRPALRGTIGPRPSASQRSGARGRHTSPRPWVTIVLMASGVTWAAAMTRSPSFSRSWSSTTRTSSPRRIASMACGMLDSPSPGAVGGARGSGRMRGRGVHVAADRRTRPPRPRADPPGADHG